jgi:hypothetical protein
VCGREYSWTTVEEKHHLVPEFYLRGFAVNEQIALTDRDLRRKFVTSVNRALKVGSFYEITQNPTLDLSEMEPMERDQYLENLRVVSEMPGLSGQIIERTGDIVTVLPGAVEGVLSYFEAKAEVALERLRTSFPDISNGDRFWVANYISLQFARGQALRSHVNESMKLALIEMLADSPRLQKDWKKKTGKNIEEASAAIEGVTIGGDQMFAVMFDVMREMAPLVFAMRWRVFEFEPGSVLTSDEPIGLWTRPGRDLETAPLGVATADAIYFPLDCRLLLQLLSPDSPVSEGRIDGVEAKLRHSNETVASAARRWIAYQPGSSAVEGLRIRRLPKVTLDKVRARMAPDGTYRELMRLTSR